MPIIKIIYILYKKKGFSTSILLKTAYSNVISTFNMFKFGLLTKDVFLIIGIDILLIHHRAN